MEPGLLGILDGIFTAHPPRTIVEVGAADGQDTVEYAKHFPAAQIHAFEPMPDNVDLLVANTSAEPRIFVHPVALGTEAGLHEFYTSGGAAPGWSGHVGQDGWPYSGSLRAPQDHLQHHPWCTFKKTCVLVCRFDDFDTIEHVDYVHMDVQGAELDVLRGGTKLLSARAIWLEVANVPLYAGQPLRADVVRFMESVGYRLLLDTAGVHNVAGDQLWTR